MWRAAVVALGLLGAAPVMEDWAVARTAAEYGRAAVIVAATLASQSDAVAIMSEMGHGLGGGQIAVVAARRLELGRLMTVVGWRPANRSSWHDRIRQPTA